MDGLRSPVGDLPPEVYWRRRLVVGGVAVLTIVVLWFLITSPSDPGSVDPTSPAPSVSPTPDPTPAPPTDLARACTDEDVTITLVASPRDFPSGSLPMFEASFQHTGSSPCLLDTGAEGADLFVRSGNDEIFYASHCPESSPINAREFLLSDSATETFQVTWPRVRSAENCGNTSTNLGAGTYRATLTVQGIDSDEAVFTLS